MKIFCILSGIIVGIVFPVLGLDYFVHNGFLSEFMGSQSLQIMGSMLAIYVAVVSVFMVYLNSLEEKINIPCINTVKELKQEMLFMIIIYPIHIFLMLATPENAFECYPVLYWVLSGLKVLTFSMYIILLWELVSVLFKTKEIVSKHKKSSQQASPQH